MDTAGVAAEGPDPTWTDQELIERAEDCPTLSAVWLPALAAVEPTALHPRAQHSFALVMQRMTAVTEALALKALAAVPFRSCRPDAVLAETDPEAAARTCPGGQECSHRWEVDELGAQTGLPKWLIDRRRSWALHLTTDWADLLPLLAAGRINTQHVGGFERAVQNANPEATAAAVEKFVSIIDGLAAPWDCAAPSTTTASARRAVERHTAPDELHKKRKKTVAEESGVTFGEFGDGLAAFTLIGDVHKLEALRSLVAEHRSVTHPEPGDTRTRGQRQVDLIIALCLSGTGLSAEPLAATFAAAPARAAGPEAGADGRSGDTARASEPGVGVIITASLETLTGLSNEPGLVGDTIVSAALIRQWAADPEWARRAVTDDHGLIRTISRKQRHPAKRLRMAVRARWARCTFPGCPQPARQSQVDHAHPYALGGDTDLENLHPLCARHHRLKEQPGMRVTLTELGAAVWTFPTGRTITVPAPDQRVGPGPYDGLYYSGRDRDIPDPTRDDQISQTTYDTWVAHIIARDPECQAA